MKQTRYLYMPKLPEDKDIVDKVLKQFLKKAFLTNSILTVAVDNAYQVEYYLRKYVVLMPSQIRCVETDTLPPGIETWSKLMDNADTYVTGSMHPKEHTLITLAYDKGLDIISTYADDIFAKLDIDENVIQTRENIANQIKQIETTYPIQSYEWILFHQGLGESIIFFYFLKNYKQKTGKKIVLLMFDVTRKSIFEECPYIDGIVMLSTTIYVYMSIYTADDLHMKNFFLLHYLPKQIEFFFDQPLFLHPYIVPKVRDFLDLSTDTQLERYPVQISKSKIDFVNQKFSEMNLVRGKTVFLIMDGVSNGDFAKKHLPFFTNLANKLKLNGYEVVTKGDHEIIPGCKYAIFHPWESSLFAGLCGHVISIPTGLAFAIDSLNQDDDIILHHLFAFDQMPSSRNNYDIWNVDCVNMIRRYGRDELSNTWVKVHQLYDGVMSSKKCISIFYTDSWNDELIEKLVENI